MTYAEIYSVALAAGFPRLEAAVMTAIAMRESGGDPCALNEVPPDKSYGLWQINLLSPAVAEMVEKAMPGTIAYPTKLFKPALNARAAATLWCGHNHNLNVAWAINRPGYKERYEAHLPGAIAAAIAAGIQ